MAGGKKRRKSETDALYHAIPFSHPTPPPGRRPPLRRAATLSSGLKGGEGGAPAFMERGYYHLPPRAWDDHAREGESVVRFPSIMPHTPMVWWRFFGFPPGREKHSRPGRGSAFSFLCKREKEDALSACGCGARPYERPTSPRPRRAGPSRGPRIPFTPPGRLPFVSPGECYDVPPPGWPLPRLAPRGPSSPHGWIIEPPLPHSPP